MLKNIKKQEKGFTIIEVLIVLAIAGLIMLIVFLAVPALQRNSRNTSYRNEAARILGAANENISNSNGNPPAVSVSGTSGSDAAKIFALANPKNITAVNVEAYSATAPTASLTTVTIRLGTKCNGTAPQQGAARQIALFYAVEDSSGNAQAQCSDS